MLMVVRRGTVGGRYEEKGGGKGLGNIGVEEEEEKEGEKEGERGLGCRKWYMSTMKMVEQTDNRFWM